MTLPSNSSMKYFPQNTVTSYTTHLSKHIQLDGKWELALVDIHYPCSFVVNGNNVDDETIRFQYDSLLARSTIRDTELFAVKITGGYYRNLDDLLNTINKHEDIHDYMEFSYDTRINRVKLRIMNENVSNVSLSEKLSQQLGFDYDEKNILKPNITELIGSKAPNLALGIPAHIYVYCDLIEPQFIGDTTAPLLNIVNVNIDTYKYGSYNSVSFTSPHYVPVMKSTFETVEIDLRDHTGKKLPFMFGTSYVKLHFRRVQQQQQQ